jgi:hypothetical protein
MLASKLEIDRVPADAIVLIPLFNIADGAIANASILAAGQDPLCMSDSWVNPSLARFSLSASRTRTGIPTFLNWNSYQVFRANPLINSRGISGSTLTLLDPNTTDVPRGPKQSCRGPLKEDGDELADISRLGTSKFMMNQDGDSFSMVPLIALISVPDT